MITRQYSSRLDASPSRLTLRALLSRELQIRNSRFAIRNAVLLLALCAFPFSFAYAQSATATLSGTIEDQNGAIIPGVSITIQNKATSLERQTTTNDSGGFTVPLLPPGDYTVTARRDGFSPVEVRNVVLNVGDQKALNIQLKAGDVNATVTVDSSVETIRTDGGVGTVVNRQFVATMPLNGRSLQALIQLTPGVVLTLDKGNGSSTGNAQFSVNGQRTTSNYFMVDGVSANTGLAVGANGSAPGASGSGQTPGATVLGGTNSLVSLDELQEFRIETSTFAPEYGRVPGGQISLLTRGGTSQFHGSASYYFRNDALDANDWFANANRLPKPKERQNLFSGVLGGPIKRDRLFFFASYEGLRLEQPNVQVVTVPTVAVRAQAVSSLRPYLNALPLPNGRDLGNGTAQFAASYSDPARFNVFAVRLDGRLTNSLTGFFRVSHAPSKAKIRSSALSTVASVSADNDSYTGGVTWVASSNLTSDLRVNWTRNSPSQVSNLEAFGGAVVPNSSDVFLPGRGPSNALFFFTAISGSFSWGPQTADVQRQLNLVGTVARSSGAHQIKLGIDYRRLLPLFGGVRSELLRFSTAQSLTNSLASSYQVSNADEAKREAIFSNLSLYVQDTWHTNRKLTLTYGLRFERVPPPTEATGRLPSTLLGIEHDVLQNPRLASNGTPLFSRSFGDFAPRFGVAYQLSTRPKWETTLRGGVGLFYDLGLGYVANAFQQTYPFWVNRSLSNVPFPLSDSARTPPALGVGAPTNALSLLDPHLKLPYTVEWNATWEQGVGTAQALTVSYVGAAGRRLLVNQFYSASLSDFPGTSTSLNIQRNLGRSAYDALQVQYNRRLQRGLQALVSYTLGHSRDNASQDTAITTALTGSFLGQEYGPSDFDVRHVLSAAVTYDLPKLSAPTMLRTLSRDWGLDLLVRYQSAFPVSPSGGFDTINGIFFIKRPDLVPGQPLYIDDPTAPGGRRFNRAAFVAPSPGQQGNFPRNGLRSFGASQVDLALRREFKLREQVRLQVRAELFNLFNHPNFGAPNSNCFSNPCPANFGLSSSMLNRSVGGLNALYQIGGPRSAQLSLKVSF